MKPKRRKYLRGCYAYIDWAGGDGDWHWYLIRGTRKDRITLSCVQFSTKAVVSERTFAPKWSAIGSLEVMTLERLIHRHDAAEAAWLKNANFASLYGGTSANANY
jgi:hypothetical protein